MVKVTDTPFTLKKGQGYRYALHLTKGSRLQTHPLPLVKGQGYRYALYLTKGSRLHIRPLPYQRGKVSNTPSTLPKGEGYRQNFHLTKGSRLQIHPPPYQVLTMDAPELQKNKLLKLGRRSYFMLKIAFSFLNLGIFYRGAING